MILLLPLFSFFFFNDTATTEIYTLSLHDALPICSAEECAFQQVLAIKYVVDIQLRTNYRAADGERIPGTRIDDEVRIHVGVLVEVEQAPSIRRIRIAAVGETGPIDARGREIESATRVDRAGDAGQELVQVEVEIPRRRIRWEEAAADRMAPIGVIDRQVHVT